MKPSEIIQALAADLTQHLKVLEQFGLSSQTPVPLTQALQAFIVNWMLDHDVSIRDAQSKDTIVVEVDGGVVQSIYGIPKGVVVEVHDYDVDGDGDETGLETDDQGSKYHRGVWET